MPKPSITVHLPISRPKCYDFQGFSDVIAASIFWGAIALLPCNACQQGDATRAYTQAAIDNAAAETWVEFAREAWLQSEYDELLRQHNNLQLSAELRIETHPRRLTMPKLT